MLKAIPSTTRLRISLEESGLSRRLSNLLLNLATSGFRNFEDLDDLTKQYYETPNDVMTDFARQPGTGVKMIEELTGYFHSRSAELPTGHSTFITRSDAEAYREAINEALHSIAAGTRCYEHLRALQRHLTSATIYVQQADDKRRIFPR